MTFHVGASGSYKEALGGSGGAGTAVGAGGVWKSIEGMWVGAGGAWKQFFQSAVLDLGSPNTNGSYTDDATTSTFTFSVNRDGTLGFAAAGTGSVAESFPDYAWILPRNSTVGDAYEVRMTKNSGTTITGTVGSWLALTSNRSWSVTRAPGEGLGTNSANVTLEIRLASTGEVLASATFDIQATVDVTP